MQKICQSNDRFCTENMYCGNLLFECHCTIKVVTYYLSATVQLIICICYKNDNLLT